MNDFSLKMEVHLAMPIRDIMNVNQYQQNQQWPLTSNHWTQKNTTTFWIGNLVPGLEQAHNYMYMSIMSVSHFKHSIMTNLNIACYVVLVCECLYFIFIVMFSLWNRQFKFRNLSSYFVFVDILDLWQSMIDECLGCIDLENIVQVCYMYFTIIISKGAVMAVIVW
jgi:hypothetical protein